MAVLGVPGGARPTHVVQFRPVRPDGVAGDLAPEAGEHTSEVREGLRQMRRRKHRDGPRHDTDTHLNLPAAHPPAPLFVVSRDKRVHDRG